MDDLLITDRLRIMEKFTNSSIDAANLFNAKIRIIILFSNTYRVVDFFLCNYNFISKLIKIFQMAKILALKCCVIYDVARSINNRMKQLIFLNYFYNCILRINSFNLAINIAAIMNFFSNSVG